MGSLKSSMVPRVVSLSMDLGAPEAGNSLHRNRMAGSPGMRVEGLSRAWGDSVSRTDGRIVPTGPQV